MREPMAGTVGTAPSAISPLKRPDPPRLRVQSALRDMIVERDLLPGAHVVEADVAARLKVKRQPVREALQALHQEGWVDLQVGRGAFVHAPTSREVNEVFEVRGVLEAEAVRLATPRVSPVDVQRLRQLSREGRGALATGAASDVVIANSRFHRSVTELAGNCFLSGLLSSLDHRVRWYFTLVVRARGEDSWDEHDEIIDAVQAGDETRAADLMRAHSHNTVTVYNQTVAGE